jgi:hypothetical protein
MRICRLASRLSNLRLALKHATLMRGRIKQVIICKDINHTRRRSPVGLRSLIGDRG